MNKSNHLSLILAIFLLSPSAFSVTKNLCDDLVSTDADQEQINKCWEKFGKSDTAIEKEKLDAAKKDQMAKAEQDKTKSALDKAQKNSNLEFKKFTESDLADAGFGKDFFAIKYNYKFRINGRPKESRITKGDSMCQYLGYEKAMSSEVSSEIFGEEMYKKGLFVDTTFGIVSKEPELFSDNDNRISVRKYTSITCVKRKDKNADVNNEALKSITESVPAINDVFTASKKDKESPVNNDPRKNTAKEGGTDYGYKRPDWANDTATTSK